MSQQQFVLKALADGAETPISGLVVAGRHAQCDLPLASGGPEGGPSRRHAQLSISEGALWVEDLGSKNGTFVNNVRVSPNTKVKLRPMDRLRFDRVEFEVHAPPPPEDLAVETMLRPQTQMAPPAARAPEVPHPAPPVQAAVPAKAPAPPAAAAVPPAAATPAVKPVPQPPPAAGSQPPVQTAAPTPAGPVNAPSGAAPASPRQTGAVKTPGAWADPDARGDGRTVFINPDKVREMMAQPARPAAGGAVGEVNAPTLILVSGSLAGGRVELHPAGRGETSEWTLGCDAGQDIVLAAADGVSGQHASITNEGERWKISDKLSKNGTFVNNRRTNSSFLASGDEVRLGMMSCVFELPGGRAARRPTAPAADRHVEGRMRPRVDVRTLVIAFVVTSLIIIAAWRLLG